jgi:hypothetical protein
MQDIPQETSIPPETLLEPRLCSRFRRIALMAAGILAIGIGVAACGGGPSTPGSATGSATTAASASAAGAHNSSASGGTQGTGLLAYSSCMRSHGVPNYPDPTSSGGIPKETCQQLGVSKSQLTTANSACQHLIPAGETLSGKNYQPIAASQQQDYLNAAACMRSHGVTNFPEPVFQAGQVEFPMLEHLVDLSSPQFQQAYEICQKLIPPGLPDSGSGSGG